MQGGYSAASASLRRWGAGLKPRSNPKGKGKGSGKGKGDSKGGMRGSLRSATDDETVGCFGQMTALLSRVV